MLVAQRKSHSTLDIAYLTDQTNLVRNSRGSLLEHVVVGALWE